MLILILPVVNSQLVWTPVRKFTARQLSVARQWFTHSCGKSAFIAFVTIVVSRLFLWSKKFADRNAEINITFIFCKLILSPNVVIVFVDFHRIKMLVDGLFLVPNAYFKNFKVHSNWINVKEKVTSLSWLFFYLYYFCSHFRNFTMENWRTAHCQIHPKRSNRYDGSNSISYSPEDNTYRHQ